MGSSMVQAIHEWPPPTNVTQQFHWPDLKHDVQQFVRSCAICQQAKTLHTKAAELLQPLPTPSHI